MRLISSIVTWLLVLTASYCLTCNLHDLHSISTCVKEILESSQPALRARYDPLVLPNSTGNGSIIQWWVSNIQLRGLANFTIDVLSVAHTDDRVLRVRFAVYWRRLVANATGKFIFCRKVFEKKHCFALTCKPKITVEDISGSAQTFVNLVYSNNTLSAFPTDTIVGFRVTGPISVEVNLDGILGVLDKFLGYPSKVFATEVGKKWWKKNIYRVQNKAKEELHKVIDKFLSSNRRRI